MTEFECANCKMQLLDLRPADLVQERPKVDDLLVCGGCATINKVTLLGTEKFSETEFAALHPDEQSDLNFAMRAIVRKVRAN